MSGKNSDTWDTSRNRRPSLSRGIQVSTYKRVEVVGSESHGSSKVSEFGRPVLREQLQCATKEDTKDDFVDEGYYSPSPTDSETEFFGGSVQYLNNLEIGKVPQTPEIAINDTLLQVPQICVTDEKGETEIIAADDDEHGQLWNFARDKIARRMFFIRADRRTQHMETTFYADLYPVSICLQSVTISRSLLTCTEYLLITVQFWRTLTVTNVRFVWHGQKAPRSPQPTFLT